MKLRLTLAVLVVLAGVLVCQEPTPVHTVIVWDQSDQKNCPIEFKPTSRSRLEAPLDDHGRPIMSQAKVIGIVVDFVEKCGRIEIRK